MLAFALIFAVSLILFFPSLGYYFFQDDWFVLNWVQTQDFASFFAFRTDIIYWRPISMPLLFFTAKNLFGINPLGYNLIAFSIFFVLIFAVYKLFEFLGFNRKLSLTTAFLYGIWPIHYISLSWFSTTSYVIGPLFQVLSFIFFIKFTKDKKNLLYIFSFMLFLFGIASSEFTLMLPAILAAWSFLIKRKYYLKFLLPYIIIDIIYLFARFYIFPIPAEGNYQTFINKQLLNNFVWYIAWAIGFPERFKSLIFLKIPWQSLKILAQYWIITIPVLLLLILLIKQILTSFKKSLKFYLFGITWFLIGLLPVITIINHSFPMYLSLSGLGFLYVVATLLKNSSNLIWILFLCLWSIVSFTNLQFTRNLHWIRNEQAISRAYMDYVKELAPNPSKNSVFHFKPANLEFSKDHQFLLVETEDTLKQSLGDQNAVQVIYSDPTLKSVYSTHQQTLSLPKDVTAFEISPR